MKKRISLILFIVLNNFNIHASGFGELESRNNDFEQEQLRWCFLYSNLLGYNITYICNPRLYQLVGNWMNAPYKYSGKSKNGIDCSGLVCTITTECYNKTLSGSAKDIYSTVNPLSRSELREGDLVFFKINKSRISHVGIYLGQNKFVHASVQRGVIVSDLNEPYYNKYFFKGGRIKL